MIVQLIYSVRWKTEIFNYFILKCNDNALYFCSRFLKVNRNSENLIYELCKNIQFENHIGF